MITADLRRAIAAAAGDPATDPGLRPTGVPGRYASSAALGPGSHSTAQASQARAPQARAAEARAALLAEALRSEPWIETAEVTGPGYLTITVTHQALSDAADRMADAGEDSAASTALAGRTVPAPPPGDPLAAPTWEEARRAVAATLTARLAAAAGATVADPASPERRVLPPDTGTSPHGGKATARSVQEGEHPAHSGLPPDGEVAAAVSYAGRDAVMFALASAVPDRPVSIDAAKIARQVLDNPAYAVRYAHSRAVSGVRWAATEDAAAGPWCPPADPAELVLLDALSWLPERVATAARRSRPDEFARFLAELAGVTIAVLPGSGRLALAKAARSGLAAGLGLLGVSAPDRL